MAFKGKPSINKRNREVALRERQKEKAARKEQRAAEKRTQDAQPTSSAGGSAEDEAYQEFQRALRERKEQDAAEAERDLVRRPDPA